MGVSTDGIIAFGIACEEGTEFPWDDEQFDGDYDEWWRSVNGYKPPFELYDDQGEYVDGIEDGDPRIDEHYDHELAWDRANPIPVSLENYCSKNCPMYAIVVPSSIRTANRGCPEAFDPAQLVVTDEQRQSLVDFIAKYKIDASGEPSWLLMSYWG